MKHILIAIYALLCILALSELGETNIAIGYAIYFLSLLLVLRGFFWGDK